MQALVISTFLFAFMASPILALLEVEDGPTSPRHDGRGESIAQSSAESVFRTVSPSVVTVTAKHDGGVMQGSGVVAEVIGKPPTSWVITAQHVIEGASRIVIRDHEKEMQGLLWYANEDIDIAVLVVVGEELKPAGLASMKPPIGSKVFTVGSPHGLENTITEGIVSGHRSIGGVQILQVSAPILPGSSGGGLFDSRGQLVGITTSKYRDSEGLSFAVAVSEVAIASKARGSCKRVEHREF